MQAAGVRGLFLRGSLGVTVDRDSKDLPILRHPVLIPSNRGQRFMYSLASSLYYVGNNASLAWHVINVMCIGLPFEFLLSDKLP